MNPDIALIGWPKSGTDSLYAWLSMHPRVQGSVPKEPFFFMDPEHPLCGLYGASLGRDGPAAYARFFPGPADGRLRFEATTHTYYQCTALECFSAGDRPIVIALLRRPEERLRSSFRFSRDSRANVDRRLCFAEYAQALLDGRMDSLRSRFKRDSTFWIARHELEFGQYAKWLAKWEAAVGRGRLHVVLFEELRDDPAGLLARLCRRLDLDPGFYADYAFPSENPTIRIRNARLHRIARRLAAGLPQGVLRPALRGAYLAVQNGGRFAKGDDEPEREALAALARYFVPHDRELAGRFGLDLAAWNTARAALAVPAA